MHAVIWDSERGLGCGSVVTPPREVAAGGGLTPRPTCACVVVSNEGQAN
jgi:hypothetical protein